MVSRQAVLSRSLTYSRYFECPGCSRSFYIDRTTHPSGSRPDQFKNTFRTGPNRQFDDPENLRFHAMSNLQVSWL